MASLRVCRSVVSQASDRAAGVGGGSLCVTTDCMRPDPTRPDATRLNFSRTDGRGDRTTLTGAAGVTCSLDIVRRPHIALLPQPGRHQADDAVRAIFDTRPAM